MSKRKEMDLPTTWSMTLGSARVIRVPESRRCQSSASPRKSGIWIAGGTDPPRGAVGGKPCPGQSDPQWPTCLYFGQGLVGGLGLGHWRAQWLSLAHLKQAPRGAVWRFQVPLLTQGCNLAGCRAATKAWVWRATFCWRCFLAG
jgi:hypothetical protein